MSEITLKLDESKQKKLDELNAVAEKSPEQVKEIAALQLEGKKARYEELFTKPETELSDAEVDEFLKLSDEMKAPREDKDKDPEPAGEQEPEDGKANKKFAGIYNSIEELAKGIVNSEAERTRIETDHPELIPELEKFYKDSQRKVTKLVQDKKDKETRITAKPLKDRRLFEMSAPEYEKWEKENKLEAQAWLSEATRLNAAQRESGQKVFQKHPEFVAMAQGIVPPSKEWIAYDQAATEHPEWEKMPNGPELCLEEMEKVVGKAKPAAAAAPKPKKAEEKPDFTQGKAGGGSPTKGKLSAAEFEKLSPDEQRRYMESSVSFV